MSQILNQINKSFRIKRSQSSRDLHHNKTKQRLSARMSTSDLREQPVRGYMIGDPLSKGPGYPVTPEGISNKHKHHKSRSRGLASINPKYTLESGLMSSSEIETSRGKMTIHHLTSTNQDSVSRFPRLQDCAHFHYEYAEIGPLQLTLMNEPEDTRVEDTRTEDGRMEDLITRSDDRTRYDDRTKSDEECFLILANSFPESKGGARTWVLRRTLEDFQSLDRQLHTCVFDRKFSQLSVVPEQENISANGRNPKESMYEFLCVYLERLSRLVGPLVTCGPILSWLELDNKGNRLIITDESDINTPAVAAAYSVRRYAKQANDEISFEVGDMISVIDMPATDESVWWRGKRGFEVGFFPCDCVEIIGDKVPHSLNLTGGNSQTLPHHHHLQRRDSDQSDSPSEPSKPVLRKHGKLITFFRSFILSRPTRGKLKKRGILKERVFSCDLGEYLLNSGQEVPNVLTHCSEFIEKLGIVDGIYRLSGISSNIQRLRVAFDEDRVPNLYEDKLVLQDIHSVSSLLKMYFRELPNPVCTFHLYDQFVDAAKSADDLRLVKLREVVFQLPPPNYRTLEYLTKHLYRVAARYAETGMTAKNVAIVWAPNLLRCKSLEVGGVAALQGVGIQAVVTEYLIKYCELIFSDMEPNQTLLSPASEVGMVTPRTSMKNRPKSLAISTPTKLISLEEARHRAMISSNNIQNQKYIEVGGGPENLPAFHTVINLPKHAGGSLKSRKGGGTAWKSIFSKEKKKVDRKTSTPLELHHLTVQPAGGIKVPLRPVKSAESLIQQGLNDQGMLLRGSKDAGSIGAMSPIRTSSQRNSGECDELGALETVTRAVEELRRESPKHHSRSSSHDSYFERKLSVQFDIDPEQEESNLDLSEIQVNFDHEDREMKLFSEDETMISNSVGSELSLARSPLEEQPRTSSPRSRGTESSGCFVRGSGTGNLDSPTKARRMSFKEKIKKKFTSPTLSRRQEESEKTGRTRTEEKSLKDNIKTGAVSPGTRRLQESSPSPHHTNNRPGLNVDLPSLSFSPSIKFIDASSSYELVSDSETDADTPRSLNDTWRDGGETIRETDPKPEIKVEIKPEAEATKAEPKHKLVEKSSSYESSGKSSNSIKTIHGSENISKTEAFEAHTVAEPTPAELPEPDLEAKSSSGVEQLVCAQVHAPLQAHTPTPTQGFKISIIGARPVVLELGGHLENEDGLRLRSSEELLSQGGSISRKSSATGSEVSTQPSRKPSSTRSDLSFSVAGATVSENESFDSLSTGDGVYEMMVGSDQEDMNDPGEPSEIDTSVVSAGLDTFVNTLQDSGRMDESASEDMEESLDNSAADHRPEGYAELQTTMSGSSSREFETKKLEEGLSESILSSDKSSITESIQSSNSDHISESSTSDKNPLIHAEAKSFERQPRRNTSSELRKLADKHPNSTPSTPSSLLNSPQFEAVTLRRSPVTSPARNRSVRSDFILNLVHQNFEEESIKAEPEIPKELDSQLVKPNFISELGSEISSKADHEFTSESAKPVLILETSPKLILNKKPMEKSQDNNELKLNGSPKEVLKLNTQLISGLRTELLPEVIPELIPEKKTEFISELNPKISSKVNHVNNSEDETLLIFEGTNSGDVLEKVGAKLTLLNHESLEKETKPDDFSKTEMNSGDPEFVTEEIEMRVKAPAKEIKPLSLAETKPSLEVEIPPIESVPVQKSKISGLAKALSPQPYNKTSVYNPRLSQEFNPKIKSAEDTSQKSAILPKNPGNSETSQRTPSWENELVWRAEPSRVEEDSIPSISLNTDPVISKPPPVPKEDVSPKSKKQHSINKVTLLHGSRLFRSSDLPENQGVCSRTNQEAPREQLNDSLTSLDHFGQSDESLVEYEERVPLDGRRSTQGIPEVEKNLSFNHKKSGKRKSDSPVRKCRAKSSTLSLHATKTTELSEEAPLQRRNSIHNVPFVDVHDPDTRCRMERYKEERRSMLRLKYKAEDYLSDQFSKKKKLSNTSSAESNDSSDINQTLKPVVKPSELIKPIGKVLEISKPPEVAFKLTTDVSLKISEARSTETSTVSSPIILRQKAPELWKLVDLKQPEPSTLSRKTDSDKKRSWTATKDVWAGRARPTELDIQKISEPTQSSLVKNSDISTSKINFGHIDDSVNVKERATIFGPRSQDSKPRTVSVGNVHLDSKSRPIGNTQEGKKRTVSIGSEKPSFESARKFSAVNPTSPSKIKNMAAMFEHNIK